MPSFAELALIKKITSLLRAGADWIKKRGQFGKQQDLGADRNAPFLPSNPDSAYSWVFDQKNNHWAMELTYSFRSLECRLQAKEAKAPPGIQSLHRIFRNAQ